MSENRGSGTEAAEGRGRALFITGTVRNRGSQATSRADTAHRYPARVDPQASSFFGHPADRPETIIERGWERVLGSQSVIGADDDTIYLRSKVGTPGLFVVKVAEDIPASMEKHQGPERAAAAGRGVYADWELVCPRGAAQHAVLYNYAGIFRKLSTRLQPLGHCFGLDPASLGNVIKRDLDVKREDGCEFRVVAVFQAVPHKAGIRKLISRIPGLWWHVSEVSYDPEALSTAECRLFRRYLPTIWRSRSKACERCQRVRAIRARNAPSGVSTG